MADIRVSGEGEEFTVEVSEVGSSTSHRVRLPADLLNRYGSGAPPEDLLVASFEFLLEREPKESILRHFQIDVIERYFPEYPREIRRRVTG